MRVLVTGASGFVGSHVMEALLDEGVQVRVLVRSAQAREALAKWPVEIVYGDLATGEGLAEAVQGTKAVFHVAALYSLERRMAHLMYQTNVQGTAKLLEVIAHTPSVERMVYTSSTAAVGLKDNGAAADESLSVDPNHVPMGYKRSKVLAEQIVMKAVRDGLDIVVVNPSTPIGSRDVKPTPTGQMIRDAVRGKMPAYVDTGLNWVSVRDVAKGHILAWQKGKTGERYILGHENLTFQQLLERIEILCGVKAPKTRIPLSVAFVAAYADELILSRLANKPPRAPIAGVQLARHPMFYTADKAVKELGLPQTPIDTALSEAIEWFVHSA